MKKRLPILGLILVILVGCQKRTAVDGTIVESTPIRLTSGIWGVVDGRAPVALGERFTATVCGWQGASATAEWSIAPNWTSSSAVLAGSTAVELELLPGQTYNPQGLVTVVRAWHPAGQLEAGRVLFDNPTGEIDVMLTQPVSGALATPITESLLFNHLTTQFRFVLVDLDWYPAEPVLSLRINGAQLPVGIDLPSGELIAGAEAGVEVPGVGASGVLPTALGADFGRAVLVVPIGGNRFTIELRTPNKHYPAIEVKTLDTQFLAGKLYRVTLTLSGSRGISVGSEVGDWPLGAQTEHELD